MYHCLLVYCLILFRLGSTELSSLIVLATTWWDGLILRSVRLEKIFVRVGNQHNSNSALFFLNHFQFCTLESDSHFCKREKHMKSNWSPYVVFCYKNSVGSDTNKECNVIHCDRKETSLNFGIQTGPPLGGSQVLRIEKQTSLNHTISKLSEWEKTYRRKYGSDCPKW